MGCCLQRYDQIFFRLVSSFFLFVFTELLTVCWRNGEPYQAVYDKHADMEILNPIQNFTYEFVGNLFKEVKESFRDPYIHLGMDEGFK